VFYEKKFKTDKSNKPKEISLSEKISTILLVTFGEERRRIGCEVGSLGGKTVEDTNKYVSSSTSPMMFTLYWLINILYLLH
jgi:hypothetical protein